MNVLSPIPSDTDIDLSQPRDSGASFVERLVGQGGTDARAKLSALDSALATIEFAPDGTILTANSNFLDAMGYRRHEVVGQHHQIFVRADERQSPAYADFWAALRRGEPQVESFCRVTKDGSDVWIQAAYTPLRGKTGRVDKVLKVCANISAAKEEALANEREIEGISRTLAVISFSPEGVVQGANENFLSLMEYTLDEVVGKHHRLFVDAEHATSRDYAHFWEQLKAGNDHVDEFERVTKSGKTIWIRGSYSAIKGSDGQVEKIVKVAQDVTAQKLEDAEFRGQIEAIDRSQAVIHFNLDGTIRAANAAFLTAMGYHLDEVVGQHHRIFVDPVERESADYAQFWAELASGRFKQAEFRRITKSGEDIWIQATYNPIFDVKGRPFKVVKYATDITAEVRRRHVRETAQGKITHDLGAVTEAVTTAKTNSTDAATASEQATQNLQAVAAGVEEMNTAIQEIASSMVRSREAADEAHGKVESANEASQKLVMAAQAMTQIVELIRGIAGQINLLSLNATIESARAGEAGKGFAVVASEIKSLARQASEATDRVAEEIKSIQDASNEVDGSLSIIRGSLDSVRDYVIGTAGAVEEQSAVARDISSNMQEATQGVALVSENMQRIATQTSRADEAVLSVAAEAQRMLG